MAIKIAVANRNALGDLLVDAIDAGSGPGTIKFYTTAQPAGPGTAVSDQTLLATLTFSDPAFPAFSSGYADASAITSDVSCDDTGTPTWFRIADSDGLAILDGSVTATAGGGDITFNTVTWVAGATVQITSFRLVAPGG